MNSFDITEIENTIADHIRESGVSEHVWKNRPKATADDIDDFAVVKVTGGISDKAAFGQCRVAVYLFSRDVREMKNDVRLSVMQDALVSGMRMRLGKLIADDKFRYVGDTADGFGFHCRIISFSVIIKIV